MTRMDDAKQIAKGIANQLVQNGQDQLSQWKETFSQATKAGEEAANKGISASPTQFWEEVKSIPHTVKEAANNAVSYTVDVYDSVKQLGHSVGQVGHSVSQVADSLDGVDHFTQIVTKDVDRFQKKIQPQLDKINQLLNK